MRDELQAQLDPADLALYTIRGGAADNKSEKKRAPLHRHAACAVQAVRDELQAQLDPADLARYAIRDGDADFEEALGGKTPKSGIVNVRA